MTAWRPWYSLAATERPSLRQTVPTANKSASVPVPSSQASKARRMRSRLGVGLASGHVGRLGAQGVGPVGKMGQPTSVRHSR